MTQFDDTFSDSRVAEMRRQEEERLIQALAPQYGIEYVNLHTITINPEALNAIPEAMARKAELVPFELNRNVLSIAFRNPNNQATQEALNNLQSKYQLTLYMCSSSSLKHGWERYSDIKETTAEKKGVLDIHPEDISSFQKKINSPEHIKEFITG